MGGPIKQGIMHGIREPYKHGGPTGTGLVGDQRYPKTGGREHHAIMIPPILMGIGTAARAVAPWAARMGSRYLPKIKRMFGPTTPGSVTKGTLYSGRGIKGKKALKALKKGDPNIAGAHQQVTMNPAKFNPNWLGRDPIVKGVGLAGKSIFNPTVGGWVGKGVRLATSPSTIIIGGLYYANGRWFNKKGEELDPNSTEVATAKAKGGDKDYGPHTKGGPTITQEMRDAKAKADKEKRINALLDTMGYDKARKNAAYDALIDAGRMVSERGTLDPKNIGRELIDPIVAATSQRFDKPEQIREAVGLMQTKADIQKEMNKEETALANRAKRVQIEVGEKSLAGNTLEETAEALFTRHGSWPSGEKLANLARNKGIAITDVIDTAGEEVGDPVAYMEGQIAQALQDGTPVPPGNYVVGKDIIIVDAEGNVRRR